MGAAAFDLGFEDIDVPAGNLSLVDCKIPFNRVKVSFELLTEKTLWRERELHLFFLRVLPFSQNLSKLFI